MSSGLIPELIAVTLIDCAIIKIFVKKGAKVTDRVHLFLLPAVDSNAVLSGREY